MSTKKVLVSFPEKMLKIIDSLIDDGYYRNRSDFINEACRAHLQKEKKTLEALENVGN